MAALDALDTDAIQAGIARKGGCLFDFAALDGDGPAREAAEAVQKADGRHGQQQHQHQQQRQHEEQQEQVQQEQPIEAAALQVPLLVSGRKIPGQRLTDTPDWDAPAPAGWWRVLNVHGAWTTPAGLPPGKMVILDWLRCGEVFAAKYKSEFLDEEGVPTCTVLIREDGDCPRCVLAWGRVPKPNGEFLDYGVVCEGLGNSPPSAGARALHTRVVEMRLRSGLNVAAMKGYVQGAGGCVAEDTTFPPAYTNGLPTAPYACGAANALLMELMAGSSPSEFEQRLLRDGYFVIDKALRGRTAEFVQDMELLDTAFALQQDLDTKSQGLKIKRRTMWVSEQTVGEPAVRDAISLMKGLAHALNPIMSRHHAACAAAGDPVHAKPPVYPATAEAVLTVPPDVMFASYAGEGMVFPGHVDNAYNIRFDRRQNARELTAILYADPPDWDSGRDGGALKLYPNSTEHSWDESEAVTIDPIGGRLVVFFSSFWHEVLPMHRRRRQITLWIFRPDIAHREEYEVVVDYMVKRDAPSSAGEMCGGAKRGDRFRGAVVEEAGVKWLMIREMWWKRGAQVPKYMMLRHPSLGQLLEEI